MTNTENYKSRISSDYIHITYLGGGWYSNIGNAFIDLGALYLLKKACPDAIIHFISDDPQSICDKYMGDHRHSFPLISKIQSDYLVFSGEVLSKKFIELNAREIQQLLKSNKNCKVIIMGGGGHDYSDEEISKVRKFYSEIESYAFISRDSIAFKNYKGLFSYAHNGIDCAFFVSDFYSPPKLSLPEFIIINIEERPSRKIRTPASMCIYTIHGVRGLRLPLIPARLSILPTIRNLFISNNPFDYLALYGNCKATYSTRVHACVVTLAYGNPAMLFKKNIKSRIFDKVGASSITHELTYADRSKMLEEKRLFLSFLKKVLK